MPRSVRTFENLEWPDWLTGLDSGLYRDPRPVVLTGAGDGTNRMFFATQYGAIFVTENDPRSRELKLFLDIREQVIPFKPNENEEGFLGLAFHPQFKENGEFFVYYTAKPTDGNPHLSVISRFRVSKDDPEQGRSGERRSPDDDQAAVLESQRRHGRVRARWLSLHRPGRWRPGRRSARATGRIWRRCSARSCGSTLITKIRGWHMPYRRTIRLWACLCSRRDLVHAVSAMFGGLTFDPLTKTCWAADVGQNEWEEIDIIQAAAATTVGTIEKGCTHTPTRPKRNSSPAPTMCRRRALDRSDSGISPQRRQVDHWRLRVSRQASAGAGRRVSVRRLRERPGVGALV